MTKTPRREWLAVVLPPAFAAILLWTAADAASMRRGWLAFGIASVVGFLLALVYTLVLARQNRLFLRDPAAVERSRRRIARFGVPAGLVIAVPLITIALTSQGVAGVLISSALGGALLGLYPGLLANFVRLRREKWSR